MAGLRLENVTKVYPGGTRAVDGLTLQVADGEFVVIVGPSGCGKSTTLLMVAGLETITSGTIRIGERVVNEVAPRDRDVAMVFQNYALYPHLTVRGNLAMSLHLRRRFSFAANPLGFLLSRRRRAVARAEAAEMMRRVHDTAGLLGITDLLDRRPRVLSGGQRQRVAFGRALVRRAQVLLLDEPLSNLDARLRVELREEWKLLRRTVPTTTLHVTHDQEEAMTLGERVVVMNAGRVHQVGTPRELYAEPADRFVAGFFGMPPMNFLAGRLVNGPSGLAFAGAGLDLPLSATQTRMLAPHAGRAVTLGIRPEAVRPGASSTRPQIQVQVRHSEFAGAHVHATAQTAGGVTVVARLPATAELPAGPAALEFDMESAHFFAPSPDGARLNAARAAD